MPYETVTWLTVHILINTAESIVKSIIFNNRRRKKIEQCVGWNLFLLQGYCMAPLRFAEYQLPSADIFFQDLFALITKLALHVTDDHNLISWNSYIVNCYHCNLAQQLLNCIFLSHTKEGILVRHIIYQKENKLKLISNLSF